MKKLLALLLVPIFLTPSIIDSTDVEPDYQPKDLNELTDSVAEQLTYYVSLPNNPVLLSDTIFYHDAELKDPAIIISQTESVTISSIRLNEKGLPVFRFKNGYYTLASKSLIFDDIVLDEKDIDLEFWVIDGVKTFDKPYTKGVKLAKKPVQSFDKVKVTKQALTKDGFYFYISEHGWVSERFLTIEDLRMKKVQKLLSDKYNKDNLSVYVKSLVTEDVAEINADKLVYAASVTKLPTLYYAQEKLNDKKFTLAQPLKYTPAVLNFEGAYDPEGSGSMSKSPDDKEYSVEHVLKAIAKESDNAASNIAGYYLADKFDKSFYKEIDSIVGQRWDMSNREATAKMAGKMMEAIYYQNGDIVTYLSETKFDGERISKDIPVQVAHKIGDAYDFRHDVAIVYAEEPFILSIFSEHMSYDDISKIANEIYGILK